MKQDGFNRVEFFNRLVQGSIRTIPKVMMQWINYTMDIEY